MEHKTIATKRGVIHYWVSIIDPSAKTLLFSHGLTADHSMFEKQVEFFKNNFNIITWDIPLHGLSAPYSHFSYENAAKDMHDILNAEHIPMVCLVGMSMGGYPSQMFAYLFPERTLGFVAIDTTPFGLSYYSKSDLWWIQKVASMASWHPANMLKQVMAKSVSYTDYSYRKMREMLASVPKTNIIKQLDVAYGGFVAENKDIEICCPVLLLLGEYDRTGKIKTYNQSWSQTAGYELKIIPKAAHFSNGDNPEEVNSAINSFVQSL